MEMKSRALHMPNTHHTTELHPSNVILTGSNSGVSEMAQGVKKLSSISRTHMVEGRNYLLQLAMYTLIHPINWSIFKCQL